ncbi:MAG TPA: hypothetical protein VHO49_02580, partial [Anaerolineales bacterium]|nr:hypothetical protein [Anaerolineales bacterium]
PGHTTFSSSDLGCTSAGGVATCELGDLNAGSGFFNLTVQVDKLKKVGIPLTLDTASYSISASGIASTNGSTMVIADVLSPFVDIPAGHWALDYVQSIWAAGITSGCGLSPLRYCPDTFTTRGEAAVFIERAMGNFAPTPSPTGIFADIPYPGIEAYTPYIEEFYNDGLTSGCATNPLMYCPQNYVSRAAMAIFVARAFSLPMPS